jgi:hypothetical protein
MKRLRLLALCALAVASPAVAKHKAAPARAKAAAPSRLKWMDGPPGLPAGAKFAVVSGDPSKEGMFKIRLKMPANYAVPPHHHPTDETVSLKSGGPLSFGTGDKLDRDRVGTLEKGYHVTMMANMNHYVFTTEPAEVEVSAMGPFQITYVDPKDDPRGTAAPGK